MFTPIKHPKTTQILGAPANWNEEENGPCCGLPIVKITGGFMYSYWRVPFLRRLAILFGTPIRLCVIGNGHPPVSIDAEKN